MYFPQRNNPHLNLLKWLSSVCPFSHYNPRTQPRVIMYLERYPTLFLSPFFVDNLIFTITGEK